MSAKHYVDAPTVTAYTKSVDISGRLMARVERYPAQKLRIIERNGEIDYEPHGPVVEMPAVLWRNGEPWLAAMAYLREKAFEAHFDGGSPTTMTLHATALAAYATFIEGEGIAWNQMPEDRSLRPTYRYRGHVLSRCEARSLARSTAANHMSVLRAYYAWATHQGYLRGPAAPYQPRHVAVRYTDPYGLTKTTNVLTSDLAIRRPAIGRRGVEEGCTPLRMADRDRVLRIAKEQFRSEFELALKIGFYSGMRLGTILGLTHTSLRKHFPSRDIHGWYSISVGPQYGIHTKNGVEYYPSMPEPLLRELLGYCRSVGRDIRISKAQSADKDLVFLSKHGAQLKTRSFSQDMTLLRRIAKAQGLQIPRFKFHDSRATFGTAFVLAALQAGHKTAQIMPRLMRLMGHASSASTMSYIDFVEDDRRMEAATSDWEAYLGLPEATT